MTQAQEQRLDYNSIQVGFEEDGGSFVMTQAQLDMYRKALDDPKAAFPQMTALPGTPGQPRSVIPGGVNARSEREFFNPPIPGKKIHVTRRVVEKYQRRDLPYLVVESSGVDENGRLIEKFRLHYMLRTQAVGEKWASQEKKQ